MKNDRKYLNHILQFIDRIQDYSKGGQSEFQSNQLIQDAIIRNIELIGEAVKQLTPELKASRADVPWQRIARLRDIIIHHYFKLDLDLLWEVTEKDAPALKIVIVEILKGLDSAAPSAATPPSTPPQK